MTTMTTQGRASQASVQVRQDKARWKRALADGSLSLASVLNEVPVVLEDLRLADLVEQLPRYARRGRNGVRSRSGETRLARLNTAMAREGVNLLGPVNRLTDRQRQVLVAAVDTTGVVA